ncbi:MAG: ribosome biogenesis GTPase YlqF [Clostridiales bacterium]|nr:ribosome biogenesis GTPase YlqF [Clostridiales bacterium]MDD7347929.1 ribosome biogenesis GTPase YlqF [Clostridiales bacterium]
MIENINWYPGHMKKTRELIQNNLKLVDAVIEVIDSRIPSSSRNPIIDDILGKKPRVIALNKADLASEKETGRWSEYFVDTGYQTVTINAQSGKGVYSLMKTLEVLEKKLNDGKLRNKPLRIMIVGVPNVGKSSLINRLTGKKSTQIGNRPGVTKGKQWLKLKNGMELLDTPGILWPKFEDPQVGLYLAFCGSIKDEILDLPNLSLELLKVLKKDYMGLLTTRYGLDCQPKTSVDESDMLQKGTSAHLKALDEENKNSDEFFEYGDGYREDVDITPELSLLNEISRKRGYILSGKRIDYERAGKAVIDEFRSGKIGRITLEKAPVTAVGDSNIHESAAGFKNDNALGGEIGE